MEASVSSFKVQNTNLTSYYWEAANPKAVVVIVHGMGEHALRFENSVIKHLVNEGYSVVSYDNFGHGTTKGKQGHCPSYRALQESVAQAITEARALQPKIPVFLYGHSMGGNLVINYVLKNQPDLKGVIATSPLLRLAFVPPKWKLSLGKLMLKIAPSVTLPSELDASGISRDTNEVKRYQEDPLVHDKISPMYTFPVFDAGEYAINNADKLKVPLLLCHGTGDKITSHEASKELANNSTMVNIKLFEDGYHELHHDLCAKELVEVVVNWLNSKL